MPDFNTPSKFNKDRNFDGVKFGQGAKLLEVEINEAQDIQNYKRNLVTGIIFPNGFRSDDSLLYSEGTLTVPASTVICQGNIFEILEHMYITCAAGDTIYLEIRSVEVNYLTYLKKSGNLSGGSSIPNDLEDPRMNVETSRRWQTQVQLTLDNSNTDSVYLSVATIESHDTFEDLRNILTINAETFGSLPVSDFVLVSDTTVVRRNSTQIMEAKLVAQSNEDYATPQTRNIIFGTENPDNTIGHDGDVYLRYIP